MPHPVLAGTMAGLRVVCCGQECELPSFLELRGLTSFWLLWELRLGPLIGAQLDERLTWRRGTEVSPGTLYPMLANLEKEGLVAKKKRGRDTIYTLTRAGQRELSCATAYMRTVFADVLAPP
jgi:DNA-binding HxlR family transcriptional regulator